MKNTWNDFMAYCLEHNVSELDFWILLILGVIGTGILVFVWVRWVKFFKTMKEDNNEELGYLSFIIPFAVSYAIGPAVAMGIVNVVRFFV